MRRALFLWLLLPVLAGAQTDSLFPIFIGRPVALVAPDVDASGRTVLFGAGLRPDGTITNTVDLYTIGTDGRGLRRLTFLPESADIPQGVHAASLSPDGQRAAYAVYLPGDAKGREQVRVFDLFFGSERTVATDTEGCIQPLAATLCVNCFFTCLATPHISPDGSKVLYAARREKPFYVVNTDGSGLTRLPVYSGWMAASPQRVISDAGAFVFVSSAPSGPTFAAAATDVYTVGLDGTGLRNITSFKNASVWASNATISADGKTIVFESNLQPGSLQAGETVHIWKIGADGSGLEVISPVVVCLAIGCPEPGGRTPSLSADGTRAAFVNSLSSFASIDSFLASRDTILTRQIGSNSGGRISLAHSSAANPVLDDAGSTVIFTIGPLGGSAGAIYAADFSGEKVRPVYAPKAINVNGITGAIPYGEPTPGGLISVYGFNLTQDSLDSAKQFPLPTELEGVSLLLDGSPMPLLAVTPWQLNAQIPQETKAGEQPFQLSSGDGARTPAVRVTIQTASPTIVVIPLGNEAQAAAFHANSAVLADRAHPAKAGEVIEIYGGGLGVTNPIVPAGKPSPAAPPATAVATVQAFIGDAEAKVVFAGLTPGLAGLYQVNVVVPDLKPGQYVVRWKVGEAVSSSYGTIAIQ